MTTRFEIDGVRGFLHQPPQPSGAALALTHSAGANCQSALLIAIAEGFCAAGWHVLRYDLAFRQARPFGPPHPSWAGRDRESVRLAASALRSLVTGSIIVGGHSYGGRQTSMLLAEDPSIARAALLLSYPLHPPKQPEKLRTAHWPNLRTPCLFVHGTADPFGSVSEITDAMQTISARHSLSEIQGAGHELNKGKFDINAQVLQPLHGILEA